jgi:hypothetical protein
MVGIWIVAKRAEGTFEIGVLGDLDHRVPAAQRVATESIVDDGARWTAAVAAPPPRSQQHEQGDAQHDGENGQHHVKAVHVSGSSLLPELRHGSSSSGSSSARSPIALQDASAQRLRAS